MTMSVPGPNDGSTPPAAFVRTTTRAPSRPEEQHRLDDEAGIVALVDVEAALEHDDVPAREPSPAAADRHVQAPSPPASRGARQRGSRRDPRRRRRARRAPSRGRSRLPGRCRSGPGRPPRERRGARAVRRAGSDGWDRSFRSRTCGPPDLRPGGRRPRPAALPARRTYRHRDAGRSPSGVRPRVGRSQQSRATKRPKRPVQIGGP